MLNLLRKKGVLKKIMWGLAILIIPAFVLWGAGSSTRSGGPKYAGKIFAKKVSFRQYEDSFLACRNQALLIYGEDFSRVAKFLDLKKEAWDQLILLYQAKKEKIEVSNIEVIQFIESLPLFQKQGKFNQDRYHTLLDYVFRAGPREFEEQIRKALKIDKLKNKVIDKVGLTDEEIEKVYKNERELAKVLYILFEPQKFEEQIHPSYEELQNYYQINKTDFKKPEQVNVQYIALYLGQHDQEVSVSEEEIQNYYSGHIEEFSVKDKKEATLPLEEAKAQIKEKLAQNKVKELLEDRMWQISDEIGEELESFEEIARKNELEIKETEFFGPRQVIPEIGLSYGFLNAAFSLKIGQVSDIIETPKGYFIIKIKQKKEAHIPALDEIRGELETVLIKQKSRGLAKDKGKELLSQIKGLMEQEKLDFSKAAAKLSLTVKETEKFSRISYVSEIGQSPNFTNSAFAFKVGEVSDLIEVPGGYCILSPKEVFPIDGEKFLQEKEEFTKELLARKKDISYKVWLFKLKKKAKLVNNIEKPRNKPTP